MTIDEEKQQLRATIRRLSAQLPFRYREAADRAIARHLLALPEYRSAGAVFCFVSAGREIDTRPILEQTLADGKMLEENTPAELFANPQNPRLKDFLSKVL